MQRTDIELELFKNKLLTMREELQQFDQTAKKAAQTVELDQTRIGRLSRMDALQSQAMTLETNRMRSIKLEQIEAALQRIDNGNFGICLKCGQNIKVGRLEFDPTSFMCVSCAR